MTTTKTTRMAFTADEIEVLYFALNAYALEMMHNSKTWGNSEARMAYGGDDLFAKTANKAGQLQSRMYAAQKRIEK